MDFTREPIIETVVTPKEGCKLVVRSSKSGGQEEYFVDSVEVVSFGSSVFFRSQERPKAFIVPASDYEILEVREARMVLKNVGLDRSIKIGGGRENQQKQPKEAPPEKITQTLVEEEETQTAASAEPQSQVKNEGRKKDRRRQYRKRRGREDGTLTENEVENEVSQNETTSTGEPRQQSQDAPSGNGNVVGVILPPPPMLISETISRYKDNALFKGAFYTKEEVAKEAEVEAAKDAEIEVAQEVPAVHTIELAQPEYGSFEATEAEEEAIFQQRSNPPFLKENDDIPPTTHFGEEQFPEKDYSRPQHDERG